ncbi:MAG: hypothetical protein SPJ46_00245, partial [Sodaliphilus sp.]|nr:hypothetical protein [Sodaliphilus sp.]
ISTQSIATMIAIKEPTNEPHIIRKNFFNIALKFEPVVLKTHPFPQGQIFNHTKIMVFSQLSLHNP